MAAIGAWAIYWTAFLHIGEVEHSRSTAITLTIIALPQLLIGGVGIFASGLVAKCIAASLLISGIAKMRLAYRYGAEHGSRKSDD